MALACNQVPPLDLRVNRLRSTPEQVSASLAANGIATAAIDGCSHGLRVLQPSGDLRQWPGYDAGHWCVQDRAAQWVAPLLSPQPGQKVLDACAAPGGKATHLAELMGDDGEIWAVDRSPGRLQRVAANAARLGCSSINALAADAASLLKERPQWEGMFERILLDAPCSGLGTLSRHPDARAGASRPNRSRSCCPCKRGCWMACCPCLLPVDVLFTPPARFTRMKTPGRFTAGCSAILS